MKLRLFFISLFSFLFSSLIAQQVGTWHTHLACYTTTCVAEAENYVYAVANGTLYRYGKNDNSVKLYSIQTGLNDTEIKIIRYNPSVKKLLIVYTNGNIDMMNEDDEITNIPFIKNAGNVQDKTVYSIFFKGEETYLATAFGIWVYKMDKREAVGTYPINATYGVSIRNEFIYASTSNGIKKALTNDNLLDPGNWETINTSSSDFKTKNIRDLYLFENNIVFRADTGGVFYLNENDELHTLVKNQGMKGMKLESGYLIPFTSTNIYLYESLNKSETKDFGTVNDISGIKNNGNFWIASGENGLLGVKRKTENQYEVFVSGLNIEGPKQNLDANMIIHNGRLLITGGGRWAYRDNNAGTLMVYEDGKWANFDEKEVRKKVGYDCQDYTSVAVDPNDAYHYFVSSYGEGVLEFKDNEFVQLYNHENSSLQSVRGASPARNYVRVGSVTFDKEGNLWATNCDNVEKGISKRDVDGNWEAFAFPGLPSSYLVDKILITSKRHKWVNVPRSSVSPGILIFDEDRNAHYETAFTSSNSTNSIRSKVCLSMVEDLTGDIWLGTQQGPIYCSSSNSANAIKDPEKLRFNHVIREDENGDPYIFLVNEQINAIAVDGGNRKWLGTAGSGVHVISPDGKETIHHFTTENSDLYSNTILSIAINDQTGEVFIGTDKGLISYQSEATEGSPSYSDVYAYPNPVRPEYDDQVVITGLMIDSNVKITDLSGNIIYQGKSAGGQMVWNCRNRSGNRVASGIYLVMSSTEKAKESVVAKIAVVNQ